MYLWCGVALVLYAFGNTTYTFFIGCVVVLIGSGVVYRTSLPARRYRHIIYALATYSVSWILSRFFVFITQETILLATFGFAIVVLDVMMVYIRPWLQHHMASKTSSSVKDAEDEFSTPRPPPVDIPASFIESTPLAMTIDSPPSAILRLEDTEESIFDAM